MDGVTVCFGYKTLYRQKVRGITKGTHQHEYTIITVDMIMYDIIRLVIETGNYSLVELLKKIDTVWIQGDLTDDQRMGLITLARENADYTSEIDLIEKVHDLEKRVKALEENDSTGDSEQYPEYTPGKW